VESCGDCTGDCESNCVRTGPAWCGLCDNVLCTACNTFSPDTCTACKDNASVISGDCVCNDTFGLTATPTDCASCHTLCLHCSVGGEAHYENCDACDSPGTASYNISVVSLKKFCIAECPTGYDDSGDEDSCLAPASGSELIISYTFTSAWDSWENEVAGLTFTAVVETVGISGLPAK
jgi:hypothetical protein